MPILAPNDIHHIFRCAYPAWYNPDMSINPPPTNDNEPEPAPSLGDKPIPISGYLWMGVIGLLLILLVVVIPLKLALGR